MPEISVIIPTYNEEKTIARCIEAVKASNDGGLGEIIVADAGHDNTAQQAASLGAKVIKSDKGRAVQMNAGAQAAGGDILYFLHADTLVPPDGVRQILKAVQDGKEAGCFRMKFDDTHWLMRFYGWCTRLPFQVCRGGDQSLFVTRKLFDQIGGFDASLPVMEDIEIIERIKKQSAFHILPQQVTTSARKYKRNGRVRLQLIFGAIHLMYSLGVAPERIARFYRTHIR